MPCPDAVLATRDRDIDRKVLQLDDAEGGADRDNLEPGRKRLLDLGHAQTEDLDIEIFGVDTQQRITDASAHEERTTPGGTQERQDVVHRRKRALELQQSGTESCGLVGHDGWGLGQAQERRPKL